tara:strand:- start:692 stop:2224 length:1533 start_codon:yes stop_codon:yes gene_type:complete
MDEEDALLAFLERAINEDEQPQVAPPTAVQQPVQPAPQKKPSRNIAFVGGTTPQQKAEADVQPEIVEPEPEYQALARELYEDASRMPGRLAAQRASAAEQYATGVEAQRGMAQQRMDALDAHGQQIQQIWDEATTQRRKLQRAQNIERTLRERARQKARADVADVNDRITNFKVDPNGAFPTLGGKIMAAISIAVGAFAQGLSKGQIPNTALRIITDAANRDIEAQKVQLSSLRTSAQNQNNLYSQLLTEHANEERAELLAMNGALTFAKSRIQQAMNVFAGEKSKAALQQLMGALDNKSSELTLQNIQNRATDERAALSSRAQAIGLMRPKGTAAGSGNRAKESIKEVINGLQELATLSEEIEGQSGFLSEAQRIGSGVALWAGMDKAAQQIGSEKHQEFNTRVTGAAQKLMKAYQGSKPSDRDWAVFIGMFPILWQTGATRKNQITALTNTLLAATDGGKRKMRPGDLWRSYKANPDLHQGAIRINEKTMIEDAQNFTGAFGLPSADR